MCYRLELVSDSEIGGEDAHLWPSWVTVVSHDSMTSHPKYQCLAPWDSENNSSASFEMLLKRKKIELLIYILFNIVPRLFRLFER